jgi:tRNA pseudouridine13 synthase
VDAGAHGLPDWRQALGRPQASGRIRQSTEDFQVRELPLIRPDGDGSHLWLEVEKRGANTEWVARQLSSCAGIPQRDVGFAGMKDRHAVSSQWFSVALQEARDADWKRWIIPGVRILQASRHSRKLKRGTLRGNRFRIVVRDLSGAAGELQARLETLAAQGMPNYFGPQRFGRDGRNLERAVRWLLEGGTVSRSLRGLFLSAARSYLFNQVLSRRVELGSWNRIVDGDIAVLGEGRSLFACPVADAELAARCAGLEIHPSGPLPGAGGMAARNVALEIEEQAIRPDRKLVDSLVQAGVRASRRSLRVRPSDMDWHIGESELVLRFELPAGCYATSVLRELVTVDSGTISKRE